METNNDILKFVKVKREHVQHPIDEQYFSNFQQEMLAQVKAEKKGRIIRLKPLYWIASSAAAVAIIVLTFTWFTSNEHVSLAHLSEQEIEDYLNQNPMHQETHHELASLDDLRIEAGDTTKVKPGQSSTQIDPKQKLASETPGFVSSSSILEELSTEELLEYIESEEIELEEEELNLLNQ